MLGGKRCELKIDWVIPSVSGHRLPVVGPNAENQRNRHSFSFSSKKYLNRAPIFSTNMLSDLSAHCSRLLPCQKKKAMVVASILSSGKNEK